MLSSLVIALAFAMPISGPALAQANAVAALNPGQLESSYRAVKPSICILGYTSRVTNPASGEENLQPGRSLGLIVSPDGLVMTHGHMKLDNSVPFNIKVTIGEGDNEKEYEADLLEKPDDINVVFLRIRNPQSVRFPYVRFVSPTNLSLGEEVGLIGLLGATLDNARSIKVARIGAILTEPRTYYCLDDRVTFGYVGGPALDDQGRLVGVVGYDLSPDEGGELYTRSNHPMVYHAELFSKYIQTPPSAEGASPGDAWLGVMMQPLSDDLAEYWQYEKTGGIVINTLVEESPAHKAGLQRGDVITSFDGHPIRAKLDAEVRSFSRLVREVGVGREIDIQYIRNGKPEAVKLTLMQRPTGRWDAGVYEDQTFGLRVRDITTDIRLRFNIPNTVKGVIVERVRPGSWANLAGLQPGVIVLKFGDLATEDSEQFKAAVAKIIEDKPKEFTVFGQVGAGTAFFRLQPRWDLIETKSPEPLVAPAEK